MRITKLILLAALIFSTALSGPVTAEMRPVLKNRAGTPPIDILKEILATQNREPHVITPLPGSDAAPSITWLADPDARVQAHFILSRPEKKIFSVRSLGNQLNPSLAALDYGIRYLHSPVLLITGNTDSEALRFFSSGYSQLDQTVRQQLDHLYPALGHQILQPESMMEEGALRQVEKNVDYQVAQAMARYSERIATGRLVVVGSVLDVANQYGNGANVLRIININGETNGAKLKKMDLLRPLAPRLLAFVGRPATGIEADLGKGRGR